MSSLPSDLARGAFEAAPDAMIIVDDAGVIRFANQQVSALFGYAVDEVVGQRVEQLMPGRYRDRHRHHRAVYAVSERVRPMGRGLELFGRRRDGSEFPVEISLSPIGDESHALIAAAIRDVSDRKRVEREIIEARRIAEVAKQNADRANQAKSRFLATASHDLRQPLQVMTLLNGMLRRTAHDPDLREALEQQEQAVAAMSRLINALLDISKLESGAIKPDPSDFAVSALFDELRREFAGLAADKGLSLDVGAAPVYVHSDRSLLGQVLRNLLTNAIKYTRRGRVELRCFPSSDDKVRVDVLDTGVGIPGTQIPFIYDEFFQVDSPDGRARDGYGLGLSIVRRIVSLLEIRMDVQSEPGKGSCFTLELPIAQHPASAEPLVASEEERDRVLSGVRVLLVDDDPRIRAAAQMLLELEGCEVKAAGSLSAALAAAADGVDIVLADYHLADGETGIDVIDALRAKLGDGLPAVLLTGDTSSAVKELKLTRGLEIASKPIDTGVLVRLLGDLLNAGFAAEDDTSDAAAPPQSPSAPRPTTPA